MFMLAFRQVSPHLTMGGIRCPWQIPQSHTISILHWKWKVMSTSCERFACHNKWHVCGLYWQIFVFCRLRIADFLERWMQGEGENLLTTVFYFLTIYLLPRKKNSLKEEIFFLSRNLAALLVPDELIQRPNEKTLLHPVLFSPLVFVFWD